MQKAAEQEEQTEANGSSSKLCYAMHACSMGTWLVVCIFLTILRSPNNYNIINIVLYIFVYTHHRNAAASTSAHLLLIMNERLGENCVCVLSAVGLAG